MKRKKGGNNKSKQKERKRERGRGSPSSDSEEFLKNENKILSKRKKCKMPKKAF